MINHQKCQKIKLHGTLTTKELKKHSSKLVGRVETAVEQRGCGTRQGWPNGKLKTQNL